jgi:hypothetical protein
MSSSPSEVLVNPNASSKITGTPVHSATPRYYCWGHCCQENHSGRTSLGILEITDIFLSVGREKKRKAEDPLGECVW